MEGGPGLDFRLLGGFSVRRGGEEIPAPELGGRLGRTLIRLLVTRRGAVVLVDVLAESLWPDGQPADPAANVAVLVSRVRRALGSPRLIAAATGGYLFVGGDACTIDAERFLDDAEHARGHLDAGHPEVALKQFLTALEWWAGEPLPEDTYADWAVEYRERLLRTYIHALEGAAKAALELGDTVMAEALAARAVAREPLREAAHVLLMRALASSGNRAAALAAFVALESVLAEELGVQPSPEAVELRRRIASAQFEKAPLKRRRLQPRFSRDDQAGQLAFVGRSGELSSINALLAGPSRSAVIVTGSGGSGKSRLLSEVAARLRVRLIAGRAFLPKREEPWSTARTLFSEAISLDPDAVRSIPGPAARALADLVPEIAELRPLDDVAIDAGSRRALVLEGGTRFIAAALRDKGAIVVDDLQWSDASSQELLEKVVRRCAGVHLVVARRDEAEEGTIAFLTSLADAAVIREIRLGPLPVEAIAELVGDRRLAETIAQETDATPLAVTEVVRVLASEGTVQPGRRGHWRPVSAGARKGSLPAAHAGQREAIRKRTANLPQRYRQVLRLLGLLGREAPARLVARALGTGQRPVLEALELLSRNDLVRAGEGGWAVSHDVIGEAVVERLGEGERAHMHALLAEALSLEGGDPAAIAQHQLLAGDREDAAASFARAAQSSLDRFAHVEAGRLAEAGLATQPDRKPRGDLLAVRAEVRARSGDLVGARDDLRALLVLKDPGPDRSRVLARMALVASGSEDFAVAANLADLALAEAGADHRARAQALRTRAIVAINLNELERAESHFEEALELFERLGDARGVADILDGRAMAAWAAGRIREAEHAMDHVASLFWDAGELTRVGFPRASRGTLLHWMGRPEEGLADADQALELERTLGNVDGQCYALCSRSGILLGLGRVPEALSNGVEALAVAQQLQHREWIAYSNWSIGQAKLEGGDLDGAEHAFVLGMEAAQNMPIFGSANACGRAIILTRRRDFNAARQQVGQALAACTPQTIYEGRLAAAELAVAVHDPEAEVLIREAISRAEEGGYLFSLPRLRELAARL